MRLSSHSRRTRGGQPGFSMIELMVAIAVGMIVITAATSVFIYGLFSFAGLGNYAVLTGQSRRSLDQMSCEIREATQILDCQSSAAGKSIVITNAYAGSFTTFSWDPATGLLARTKNDSPTEVLLSGCDEWDFTLFQRTPTNGWTFYPTTSLPLCKLINMRWKSSRSILGKKINTENVVTAQIVLRNKP